jgi:hypothetical protein
MQYIQKCNIKLRNATFQLSAGDLFMNSTQFSRKTPQADNPKIQKMQEEPDLQKQMILKQKFFQKVLSQQDKQKQDQMIVFIQNDTRKLTNATI